MATEQTIRSMLEPTVEALGFELWGIEYRPAGRHTLLRLYIEGEDGVGVDDCAAVSRHVSGVLDVEDPIGGEYTLEVSSPGVDRLLFRPEQYPHYAGEWIEIRLRAPREGRRNFKGTLKGIEAGSAVVQVDGDEHLLPLDSVDRARVRPRIGAARTSESESG